MKFDVWAVHAKSGLTDVLLPPEFIKKFKDIFEGNGLEYTILDSNIQK